MKAAVIRFMTPFHFPGTLQVLLTLYLAWWPIALALHVAPSTSGVRSLLLPACVLVVGAVAIQFNILASAIPMLERRRAPTGFIREQWRRGMLQLGIGYLALVATLAPQFVAPTAGVHPLAPVAILSLLACATWLGALGARRYPSAVAVAVVGLAWLVLDRAGGLSGVLLQVDAMDRVTLALMSLAWPLLAAVLAMRADLPAAVPVRPDGLWRAIATAPRRFSAITWSGAARKSSAAGAWHGAIIGIFLMDVVAGPTLQVPGPVYVWHILPVALAIGALSALLPARDLHWRAMLAPGGWRPGQIGLRLWLWAYPVYAAMVLLSYGFRYGLDFLFNRAVERAGAADLVQGLVELSLLVALGVLVRGGLRNVWGLLGLTGGAMLAARLNGNDLSLFVQLRDSHWYVPALLAATGVAVLIANRVWTMDRLMAAART